MFIEKKISDEQTKTGTMHTESETRRLSITVIDNVKPLNQIKNNKRVFK